MKMTQLPRVVVVGAGFGGLEVVKSLKEAPYEVLLIDRNNYHLFFPLLYQVASSELETEQIVYPIRRIIRKQKNATFIMTEVTDIDPTAQVIETSSGLVYYDYLVLALGSETSFFGVKGAKENSFQLKSLNQAVELRNHILRTFEKADQERNPRKRQELLTLTIIGGGPTGVEYVGALTELVNGPLRKDFRGIDFSEVSIILVEGNKHLLGTFPSKLQNYAKKRLEKIGVKVKLGHRVVEVRSNAVILDNEIIRTSTVVWSAGIRGPKIIENWGFQLNSKYQIKTNIQLEVNGHQNVFAIGDMTSVQNTDQIIPQMANPAIQMGRTVAKNLIRKSKRKQLKSFNYKNRGSLAVIGRNSAVAHVGRLKFGGFFAWLLWLNLHLFKLVGFRNRLLVFTNWIWTYIFYDSSVRIITSNGRLNLEKELMAA